MLKTWTLLLLCGLLPFSQGVVNNVFSVAQVDKAVLENVITDTLANGNLLQGALGGGLLGGGRGSGGILGGLTGGRGGGLLGLGGLLGGGQGGGLLGGLLGGGRGGGRGGGLLGLGGLLGGGQGGGLLGLSIVDIILPRVELQLRKGPGLGLNIYTKVALNGNSLLGGLLNLQVEVNITGSGRMVQSESGAPMIIIEDCSITLGTIQILSGFLPLSLDGLLTNLLTNVIPGLLCPVIELVFNVVNLLLGTVESVCPLGLLGTLHYTLDSLPVFNDQYIILNLNLAVLDGEGKAISLPTAQLPSLPLPPLADHTSQLLLSGELLSSLLRLLVSKGALNADITDRTVLGSVPMTTTALQSLLPQASQLVPAGLPIVVQIRVLEVPAVSLENGAATLTLDAAVQVSARTNSGLKPLLAVNVQAILSGRISVTPTKLGITVSLQSVALSASSSEIGSFEVSGLTNWITDILRIGYLPVINGALDIGIPLPNLFNLNFADASVTTVQDAFVLGTTPKLL